MKHNNSIKRATACVAASAVMLGAMSMVFAANVDAPAVKDGYTRYEAEYNDKATNIDEILTKLNRTEPYVKMVNGSNNANFNIEGQGGQSGMGVSYIDNSGNAKTNGNVIGNFNTKGASALNYDFSNTTSLQFTIEREEAGMVEVILGFRSSQENDINSKCANIPLKCNDGTIKELVVSTDGDTPLKQASTVVDMKQGTNTIYVGGPVSGGGWINIDYIDVSDTTTPGSCEKEEEEAEDLPINPIVKTIYTADPSAHVWSSDPNTLYVYPSHDRYPNIGCSRMDAYHIYKTQNMVDYEDCGEIFGAYDLEWGREAFENGKFDDGTFMWAPDAAYSAKTGKYYFYYPRPADEHRDEWRVGVAVSDYPDHGFVDTGIPVAGIGGHAMIDPCVFTDEDGRSYLYLAGGGNWMNGCAVAELNDDMVTLKETPKVMTVAGAPAGDDAFSADGAYIAKDPDGSSGFELKGGIIKNGGIPDYHEGPYVFKRDGIYYLMYADGYEPAPGGRNRQRYVYSTVSPKGPWTVPTTENTKSENDGSYGVILDSLLETNQDTSHGSIVEFKNKWYIFYHNKLISESSALRSACVDEVTFAEDGSINQVTPTNGNGIEPVGTRLEETAPDKVYEAENANFGNDSNTVKPAVDTFTYKDDEYTAVTQLMIPGAYVNFENVDGGNGGRVNLKFRYSATTRCYTKLTVNGRDYSFINLMGTGGKGFFKGESNITVLLNPGENNTISLTEFNNTVSLDKLEVRYLDKQ